MVSKATGPGGKEATAVVRTPTSFPSRFAGCGAFTKATSHLQSCQGQPEIEPPVAGRAHQLATKAPDTVAAGRHRNSINFFLNKPSSDEQKGWQPKRFPPLLPLVPRPPNRHPPTRMQRPSPTEPRSHPRNRTLPGWQEAAKKNHKISASDDVGSTRPAPRLCFPCLLRDCPVEWARGAWARTSARLDQAGKERGGTLGWVCFIGLGGF